jgi:hypothetical protein
MPPPPRAREWEKGNELRTASVSVSAIAAAASTADRPLDRAFNNGWKITTWLRFNKEAAPSTVTVDDAGRGKNKLLLPRLNLPPIPLIADR